MPIPKKKTPPVAELACKKTLMHGPPKSGKTTVASTIPDSIILATEPGLGSVEAMRWEDESGNYVIDSWEKLMAATKEVVEAKRFKVVVIDTLDNAVELCREFVCKKHGEEYHADGKLAFGKGTSLINNEFRRYLMRLGALNMGVVLLAHTVSETIEADGREMQRSVPNVSEKIRRPILGMMDLILFADFEVRQEGDRRVARRVFRTKPNPAYEAGDRTGRLPNPLAMDWNALREAFEAKAPVGAAVAE